MAEKCRHENAYQEDGQTRLEAGEVSETVGLWVCPDCKGSWETDPRKRYAKKFYVGSAFCTECGAKHTHSIDNDGGEWVKLGDLSAEADYEEYNAECLKCGGYLPYPE